MKRFALAVDGGGVRGIIPSKILSEIENRSKKPNSSMFDLMVGTSTGAFVVAGLSLRDGSGKPKYKANNLVDFYIQESPKIFQKQNSWLREVLLKVEQLYTAKYSAEPLEKVLMSYFGDAELKDVVVPVMITAHDVGNNVATYFKSYSPHTASIKMRDILRATSAAPTFFTAKKMTFGNKKHLLVDGVLFANNPCECAYVEGKLLYPDDDIYVMSLGTGRVPYTIMDPDMGVVGWGANILKPILNSASQDSIYHMEVLLKDKFLRLQGELKPGSDSLDDYSEEYLKYWQEVAVNLCETNKDKIDRFIKETESKKK